MNPAADDLALRSRLLSTIWFGSTLLLVWHASADLTPGDSGEIGGAGFDLGVAHPTGFPLVLLLLRAAALIPLGSIAFRENLLVASVGAAVVSGLAACAWRLCVAIDVRQRFSCFVAASVAAWGLLSFQTFLNATLGVEVYAFALALLCAAALCVLSPSRATRDGCFGLCGIALGSHVTAPLSMVPLLLASCAQITPGKLSARLAKRACLILPGALSIVYLPLAARRNSAFDWGDPRNLGALYRHLSAARIREAYVDDMFRSTGESALALFAQLTESRLLCALAIVGILWLWRMQRTAALSLLGIFCLDLGYALWINPMGIPDRQVGHASAGLIALCGGLGAAALC
jgi:hypothetical protein